MPTRSRPRSVPACHEPAIGNGHGMGGIGTVVSGRPLLGVDQDATRRGRVMRRLRQARGNAPAHIPEVVKRLFHKPLRVRACRNVGLPGERIYPVVGRGIRLKAAGSRGFKEDVPPGHATLHVVGKTGGRHAGTLPALREDLHPRHRPVPVRGA